MAALWTFVLAMWVVSAVLTLVTAGLARLDTRLHQWPALWATALLLCVAIPALGLLVPLLPTELTSPQIEALSLHGPFEALGLIPPSSGAEESGPLISLRHILTGVMAIYLGGVALQLLRLTIGRHRIRQILKTADCADIPWQEDVLLSDRVGSPFAYTPFGAPRDARIVLPKSYRGVISAAQIDDILRHERAHLARRDDECGLVLRVVLCLCWVSPFAHRLFAQWSQSTELRCDMAVTAGRDANARTTYADTLVQAVHIMAGRVRQYPAAAFSTPRLRNEQMRIEHIMCGAEPSYKRRRDHLWLGVAAACVTVTGMLSVAATANADPVGKKGDWNWVSTDIVSGNLTARFGPAPDPFNEGKTRDHYGVDIAAPIGTPIYAPSGGMILAATDIFDGKPAYGKVVELQSEDGTVTRFTHLDGYLVKAGQRVWKGDQIATVGSSGKSTGPHVHIETYRDGKRVDPQSVWDIRIK